MASTTVVPNAIIPEFLSHTNYEHWSQRVKTYLLSEVLWDVVQPSTKIPTPNEDDDERIKVWERKKAKALHIIQNSCGSDMFSDISGISSAQRAWADLKKWCKEKQKAENEFERYIPFSSFVNDGDWENAKECLTELPDAITARNEFGDIALHIAARQGHQHIVKELVLLMGQDDLQTKNADGLTALHEAFMKGRFDTVKELLPVMGGVKDGRHDEYFDRYIPFTNAVIEGDWNNAKDYLRDLNPYRAVRAGDPRDGHENTALHVAIKHGHVDIVKELVSLMTQEDLEVKNADPFTGNLDADLSERAVVEMAKYMVEQNEILLARVLELENAFGDTPLHEAVSKGDMSIVEELVPSMRQEGFVIKNNKGVTALHQAVMNENVDIVKIIVPRMRPEDLEIKNDAGRNVLHIAVVENKDMVIVRELMSLMRPQAMEAKDGVGSTALDSAINEGANDGDILEMAKYMAEKNKNVFGIRNRSGRYIPVVCAAAWGKWKITHYLYSVTPLEALSGQDGAQLIAFAIERLKALDLAWNLLQHFPRLAIDPLACPLFSVATAEYAFGVRSTFWQSWIYNG